MRNQAYDIVGLYVMINEINRHPPGTNPSWFYIGFNLLCVGYAIYFIYGVFFPTKK